jgi:hypothetical protein
LKRLQIEKCNGHPKAGARTTTQMATGNPFDAEKGVACLGFDVQRLPWRGGPPFQNSAAIGLSSNAGVNPKLKLSFHEGAPFSAAAALTGASPLPLPQASGRFQARGLNRATTG